MKLLIELPDTSLYTDMYKAICESGSIYDEDNETIAKAIKDGVLISADATNGDMIMAMCPDVEFKNDHEFTIWGYINNGACIVRYDIDWWNAPYKKEIADESTD